MKSAPCHSHLDTKPALDHQSLTIQVIQLKVLACEDMRTKVAVSREALKPRTVVISQLT
jgi:hypothetical protein